MSLTILEEILKRYQQLSDQAEIAEWDRASVLGMLADISKVCHEEQARTDEMLRESVGREFSSELLQEILGS
jgi:chaperonin cofactor prefoldin